MFCGDSRIKVDVVGTTKSHAYKLGCLLAWIDDKTWKLCVENNLGQVQKIWMNDTVQAEQLQASVLAHLAEDADVGAVLDEVMSEYGSSMLLHDIGKKEYSTTLCLNSTRKHKQDLSFY
jgi:hypothetical protein